MAEIEVAVHAVLVFLPRHPAPQLVLAHVAYRQQLVTFHALSRPAHADVGCLGGDHHVTATEQGRVSGKAPAGVDTDERHLAR